MSTHFLHYRTRPLAEYPLGRTMNVVNALAILAAGCGQDVPHTVEHPDLGATADLAPRPDLATPPDLAAPVGTLTVDVDPDTAPENNYLMGSINQNIGTFRLCAGPVEKMEVQQIVVSFRLNGQDAIRLPTNIGLIDQDTGAQIGKSVAALGAKVNGQDTKLPEYGHAVFSNVAYVMPPAICKFIKVKVDYLTYELGGFSTTGQTLVPAILASYTNTPGQDATVTAVGLTSGQAITATVVASPNWPQVPGAYGFAATLYRTKLTVSWASDTPQGLKSPNAAQVVGEIVVTNIANAGNYTATIQVANLDLATTIKPLAESRVLTIFKDSPFSQPLATHTFNPGQLFSPTTITPANFNAGQGVTIAAGQSKTFFVTLDTSEAMSTQVLSIRMKKGGVVWSDGVSSGLTAMGLDLPLLWKTLLY